jgi:hypothetical protein
MYNLDRVGSRFAYAALFVITGAGCTAEVQPGHPGSQSSSEPTAMAQAALTSGAAAFVIFDGEGVDESYNSTGGSVSVVSLPYPKVGQYQVSFNSLGSNGNFGDVQVTAFGSNGERCNVVSWVPSGTALVASVNCFGPTGAALDSGFMASYVRRTDAPGPEGAYLWASLPSSASYQVTGGFAWNSTNGAISIVHTPGSGLYSVNLAGQNLSGGTVQVTAYGAGNAYCKVENWGGTNVNVACFNGSNGQPVESKFDLVYDTKSPNNTPSYTYAWANQPTSNSYSPLATYEHGSLNSECGPITEPNVTITRLATGLYFIDFPGMASIAATPLFVKVTGYGGGSDTCEVADVGVNDADGEAWVNCFSANGTNVDATFTITYSSFAYTVC